MLTSINPLNNMGKVVVTSSDMLVAQHVYGKLVYDVILRIQELEKALTGLSFEDDTFINARIDELNLFLKRASEIYEKNILKLPC